MGYMNNVVALVTGVRRDAGRGAALEPGAAGSRLHLWRGADGGSQRRRLIVITTAND